MSLCFSISAIISQTDQLTLNFTSGIAKLHADADGKITMDEISDWDSFGGFKYGLVSLQQYPKRDERLKLEQEGIFILEFIPPKAYLVRIAANATLQSLNHFGVMGSSAFLPEFKNAFHQQESPKHAVVSGSEVLVNVHPYSGIEMNKVRSLLKNSGFEITAEEFTEDAVIIRCEQSDFKTLSELPFVHYIDWRYDPGEPENYTGRTLHRVNFISPENTNGLNYDGSGINVMLQDDGEIGPHIDFQGRLDQTWPTSSGDHGDHCAGIICGAGNLSPFNEGQAKGSDLHVYKASPQYTGFDSIPLAYYSKNIVITSTSYSNGCNAGYTSFTQEMDEQVYDMESLMHVFSAGNNGTSDCGYGAGSFWGNITGGHKMGKNVITVANLDKYDGLANSSSRGPANDGRIKPDISAKGTSVLSTGEDNTYNTKTGTSMSCPGVSGTLAVLYEGYKDVHGSLPESGLMKAIVLNTADDLGNTGPDFKHGWGRINARKAFEVINDTAFLSGSLSDGDSVVHSIQVPSNTAKVRFMVYWTDQEAAVNASTALVNDLDLSVTPPSFLRTIALST
ncbi:MAG: S8 family serine peptidase [Flavobacteriales bacterium]